MRKPFVAGNWKMNLDRRAAKALADAVREAVGERRDVDVALFPAFVYVEEIARALAGSPVRAGAQNCSDRRGGAFTGEVSPWMLADVGAELVIVGHSERRHLFGETSEWVGRKAAAALEAGLDVILCVGETLEERQAGRTEAVVREQLTLGLDGFDAAAMARVTIAYEPVWAIGTGVNATPEQASEVHTYLRGLLEGLFGPEVAEATRIQYGGSVKPENAAELLSAPHVDGALVGGASLSAEGFLPIIEAARRTTSAGTR